MKTQQFIRMRDDARSLGWDITQTVHPAQEDLMIAEFKKPVAEVFSDMVRTIKVEFVIEDDETKIMNCWYNDRAIRPAQVRNLLENL